MNQCYGEEGGGTDEEELVFGIIAIHHHLQTLATHDVRGLTD